MKTRAAVSFVLGALLALALATMVPGIGLAADSEVLSSGKLSGRSRHTASGGVSVLRTNAGTLVVLESDFSFDGAPDPKLAFGKAGYDKDTIFSPLRSNGGAQVYALPSGFDPTGYDELWIWCEKFNVPLGVAKLR